MKFLFMKPGYWVIQVIGVRTCWYRLFFHLSNRVPKTARNEIRARLTPSAILGKGFPLSAPDACPEGVGIGNKMVDGDSSSDLEIDSGEVLVDVVTAIIVEMLADWAKDVSAVSVGL